jgi:hypothetical protein
MKIEAHIGPDTIVHAAVADWDDGVEFVESLRKISGGQSIALHFSGCAQIEGVRPPAEVVEERE